MKTIHCMRRKTPGILPPRQPMPCTLMLVLLPAMLLFASQTRAEAVPQAAVLASNSDKTAEPRQASSPEQPGVSPEKESGAKQADPVATPEADLQEIWGIKIMSVRLTAGGCMIDFRYRVLDPEKAVKLSDAHLHPCIVDEGTGTKFIVPSPPATGPLRNTRKPVADKNYFVIFANPANFIKSGGKVTVVIGDLKLEHLSVE